MRTLLKRTPMFVMLAVLSAVTLFACGGDGDGDGATKDVVVLIPEGAHASVTEATIKKVSESGYPDVADLASPVFDIGPSGTQFEIPVTIGIPIDADTPDGTVLEVVRFNESSSQWEPMAGSTIVGSMVLAKTDHFSIFAVLGTSRASSCDNVWTGGPGTVAPLLVPDGITLSNAIRQSQVVRATGSQSMALASQWTVNACSTVVTGTFGPGLTGAGAWTDFTNAGRGGSIPQGAGGTFSFTLNAGDGPELALADPCHAALGNTVYNLSANFTVAVDSCGPVDPCAGVTCTGTQWCEPATATCVDALPGQGECVLHPNSGTCGSTGAGKCVHGRCMLEIIMDATTDGQAECLAQGLMCDKYPVFTPPQAACQAFHPTASVTTSASGWRQSVYCDNATGAACQGKTNTCHNCPACNIVTDAGGCLQHGTDLAQSLFVSCIPIP